MKMVRRLNPFHQSAGWRGPNCHVKFQYLIGDLIMGEYMSHSEVKRFFGSRFDDFKIFYKQMQGKPKMHKNSWGRWEPLYKTYEVWDRALTWKLGEVDPNTRRLIDDGLLENEE